MRLTYHICPRMLTFEDINSISELPRESYSGVEGLPCVLEDIETAQVVLNDGDSDESNVSRSQVLSSTMKTSKELCWV